MISYLQQIPYVCGIHILFSLLRDPGITKSSLSYPENGKPPGIDPFGYPKMAKDMKDNERQIERTGRKTRKMMNVLLHFSVLISFTAASLNCFKSTLI